MAKTIKLSKKGYVGEKIACVFLKKNGYKIITQNFRSMFGEIDIIALKNSELCFCEVKTRWSGRFGKPEESVTSEKIRKISKTIEYYLYLNNQLKMNYKIIIIAQILSENGTINSQKIIEFN